MARHRTRSRSAHRWVISVCASIAAVVLTVVLVRLGQSKGDSTTAGSGSHLSTEAPSAIVTVTSARPAPSSASIETSIATAPPINYADPVLNRLVAAPAPGAVRSSPDSASVAAVDLTSGRTVRAGADDGMTIASVGKVQVLETFLLDRQLQGRTPTDDEVDDLTDMIEHSDNDAADDVFRMIGDPDSTQADQDDAARRTVIRLGRKLGLSASATVQGSGILWGLTTTGSAQEVVLLRNLLRDGSPLHSRARSFALDLMGHVEADQRWGISAVPDSRLLAIKDGWLSVGRDDGLWADNSAGILQVDGHTILIAVLTQHNDSDEDGRDRVAQLARAAVAALLRG